MVLSKNTRCHVTSNFIKKKLFYLLSVLSDISTFLALALARVGELVRNNIAVRIKITKKVMVTNNYIIY